MRVSPETVEELVARTWRDLTWESASIPNQGMDHAVVKLHGVSSSEGELADMIPETVVIRVPYEEAYRVQAPLESAVVAQLSKRHFAAVRARHEALDAGKPPHNTSTGDSLPDTVRVPGTVRQSYVRGTFGTDQPLMLTMQTEVRGEPMAADVWSGMSEEQKRWAAKQLGGMLAGMRSLDPDLPPVRQVESWWCDGAGTTELNRTARSLPGKFALMKRRLPVYLEPNLSSAEMSHVREVFAELDGMLRRPGQQRCLTHGDLLNTHVLWDEHGGVGVIDFSDMTVGDPALDYAHFADTAPELPGMVLEAAQAAGAPLQGTREDLLHRAEVFKQWDNIFLLIDHYRTGSSPRVELI
ncbi:phosphotransferase [Corynebacterium sp. 4HC-13]|uniref:Phosphotransferase n=1 Tax=Corynebacterium anserum TaxID=2684406 RepID=A0A7G7YRB2_9CORY|nr:phosphotransferase [Corynebacterium anserum]QNH97032.1 phosphotransferase [Corynebacterium anserum]